MPERDIDGLIAELDAIQANKPMPFNGWTLAVLTANDAIFPFDNQCRAWEGTRKLETGWPHLPDFQYLVDNCLIDKSLVQARFSSATKTYDEEAEVQRMIGAQLWDLLRRERPALSGEILEVGPGTGVFTSFYIDSLGDVDWLYLMDLTPQQVRIPAHINMQYIQGDAEMDIRHVPSGSLDAIVSNCAIQWFPTRRRCRAGHARPQTGRSVCLFHIHARQPPRIQGRGRRRGPSHAHHGAMERIGREICP